MVKHRIIFMIISRQYKYLGAEWVREFKKTVTRTKKNGFLACLLLTVLLLHTGCVQAAAAVIFSRGRCQARRGGVGLGMDQDIITIEFDCMRLGNVNKSSNMAKLLKIKFSSSTHSHISQVSTWNHPYVRHRTHKTNGSFLYGSPGLENKTEICFM